MKFSASVVTYESDLGLLDRMLDGLRRAIDVARQSLSLQAEVVVVINDEDPDVRDAVRALVATQQDRAANGCQMRIIEGHGNVGYGPGQNRAIELARTDYHLILNPDVLIEENSVRECVRFLESHADVAVLAPQGFDSRNEYARLAKRHPSVASLALRALGVGPSMSNGTLGRRVARYTYVGELPSTEPHEISLASGCFMFCRTSSLQTVNGFDERYFLYFEDYDLSVRIREVGRIMEVPFARITHFGGQTATRGARRIGHFIRSGVTFFNTHGWAWL